MKKGIIIGLGICLAVACTSKQDKEKIEKIDTMLTQCSEIKQNLNGTLLDSVNQYYDSVKTSLSFLNTYQGFNGEISQNHKDLFLAFYHVSSVEKTLKKYNKKYRPQLENDVTLLEKQLTNLRHDIKKNSIDDELKEQYFQAEDSAFNIISKMAEARMEQVRIYINKYTENKDKVEELTELLKQQQ